jgi:hypothetical protein
MTGKLFLILLAFSLCLNGVIAEDIAYVIKNAASPNSVITSIFNSQGLTYKIVYDKDISLTNFSKYRVVFIESDAVNRNLIPYNYVNSLFLNKRVADSAWNLGGKYGETSADFQIKAKDFQNEILKNATKDQNNNILTYNTRQKITQYITIKPSYITNIASTSDGITGMVIASGMNALTKARSTFFGLPDAQYWTEETRLMFKNALKFEFSGQDRDGDGYYSDVDCDDNNPNVYPGAIEIPYNGLDDNCDGYDLLDVDNDGYCKEGYIIKNKNLQCFRETGTAGTDCNDNDASINPSSSDSTKNCKNDPPIVESITKKTVDEGEIVRIIVNAHDPENDVLTYSINDSRFSQDNNIFTWQTGYNDAGNYNFRISVSDGELTGNVNFQVEIKDKNQPPQFNDISCDTEILEDNEYSCEISAHDFENDRFSFSVINENELDCYFENNILKYKSFNNYFGSASCLIRVSDDYGYNEFLFNVNIENVNDAPVITSFYPGNDVKLLKNSNQSFNVVVSDIDSSLININWFIDNLRVGSGTNYIFNKDEGDYLLTAIADDGELNARHSWNIFVKSIDKLTCNEANGYTCRQNETCIGGSLLGVNDTKNCCSVACSEKPPEFKNIKSKCKTNNSKIEIKIRSIFSEDKFKLGGIVTRNLEIRNNADEKLKVDFEAYLYDLTKDKIIQKDEFSLDINAKFSINHILKMNVPGDLNENDKYALFVKAKADGEDYCNESYNLIQLEREEDMVVIETKRIEQEDIRCGDYFDFYIKIKNAGTKDQKVSIKVENSALKIKEETENIILEKYDKHDSEDKSFNLMVPEIAKAGNYTLKISVFLNNNTKISDEQQLVLGECKNEESSNKKIDVIKLTKIENLSIFGESDKEKFILWNTLAISFILGIVFVGVVYKRIKTKRTSAQVQKEIKKIIKRKNGYEKRIGKKK